MYRARIALLNPLCDLRLRPDEPALRQVDTRLPADARVHLTLLSFVRHQRALGAGDQAETHPCSRDGHRCIIRRQLYVVSSQRPRILISGVRCQMFNVRCLTFQIVKVLHVGPVLYSSFAG